MSDTREAAQEELIAAGMASGMDDTLGSSFATSFAVPPPPPKAAPAPEPEQKKDTPAPTSEEPEEELEDWRPEYEARLKAWQEESAIAREKAEKTRARIEKQREEERKAAQGSDAKAEKQRKEAEARKAKLQEELEGRKTDAKKAVNDGSAKDQAERGQKVKEAWEMVKKAGEPSSKEVTTDGRGVTANDTNVHIAGESKAPIQPTMYDPTTSTEPIPPTMQDPSPPATTRSIPTGSTSQSRQSATSQAWEEISGGASSAEDLSPPGSSSDELIDVSSSNNALGRGMTEPVPRQISPSGLSKSDNNATPPSQPPSLTLSLFSTPSHLSASRVLAVLGINLVLPFINGVMLGLGEIFARETLQVIGRKWWRNKRSIFGGSWGEAGKHETPAGRGVGSVGLSGSGGFP